MVSSRNGPVVNADAVE